MLAPAPNPLSAPPTSLAYPPFAGGRVLGDVVRVSGRNAFPFCLVTVAFLAPAILFDLVTGDSDRYAGPSMVLWNVLGCFATAALVRGTLDSLEGRPVRTSTLFRTGSGSGFRVLGVSIIQGLILVLGLVLLVVPGLIAGAGLYVASAVVVAESGEPTRTALERSWSLTRGHRWATLGIAILLATIPFVVAFGVGAVEMAFQDNRGPAMVVAVLGNMVLAVATGLPAVAAAVAYHGLRAEKEGVPSSALGAVFE